MHPFFSNVIEDIVNKNQLKKALSVFVWMKGRWSWQITKGQKEGEDMAKKWFYPEAAPNIVKNGWSVYWFAVLEVVDPSDPLFK